MDAPGVLRPPGVTRPYSVAFSDESETHDGPQHLHLEWMQQFLLELIDSVSFTNPDKHRTCLQDIFHSLVLVTGRWEAETSQTTCQYYLIMVQENTIQNTKITWKLTPFVLKDQSILDDVPRLSMHSSSSGTDLPITFIALHFFALLFSLAFTGEHQYSTTWRRMVLWTVLDCLFHKGTDSPSYSTSHLQTVFFPVNWLDIIPLFPTRFPNYSSTTLAIHKCIPVKKPWVSTHLIITFSTCNSQFGLDLHLLSPPGSHRSCL